MGHGTESNRKEANLGGERPLQGLRRLYGRGRSRRTRTRTSEPNDVQQSAAQVRASATKTEECNVYTVYITTKFSADCHVRALSRSYLSELLPDTVAARSTAAPATRRTHITGSQLTQVATRVRRGAQAQPASPGQ